MKRKRGWLREGRLREIKNAEKEREEEKTSVNFFF